MATPVRDPAQTGAAARAVAIVGLLIGVALASIVISRGNNDPAAVLAFGVEATEITDYAEDTIGRELPLRPGFGHDGRFFYLQALDPLVLDPDGAPSLLGRPTYRSQRMLYPMIASAGGLVPAPWLPWTMLLTNLAALAFGTAATARVAMRRGGSAWWGLAFAVNAGVLFELGIGASGVVALAAAMAAIDQIDQRRTWRAVGWLVAAVLAREALLVFAFGVALSEWARRRRLPIEFLAVPAAALSWAAYLRWRLPDRAVGSEVIELGSPFDGVIDAAVGWTDSLAAGSGLDLAGALVVALAAAIVIRHAVAHNDPLAWGATAMIGLVVILSRPVWQHYYDITRAASPLLTAALVLAFCGPRPARRQGRAGSERQEHPAAPRSPDPTG